MKITRNDRRKSIDTIRDGFLASIRMDASTYDVSNGDPATTIVLLHAAIGDRRMWQPQWGAFGATHRVVRIDLRGFGAHAPSTEPFNRSANVMAVLDLLDIDQAVLVGASMGGRVALDLAVAHPARVCGLMLIGSAMSGHDWSKQVQDLWALEQAALDAGDIAGAVDINLEFWLDGPARQHAHLSARDRALVSTMQRRAFELELANPDAGPEVRDQTLSTRLHEIEVPTSILYGLDDPPDIAEIAGTIAEQIPHSSLHPIADAAHLPSLEQPAVVNNLLEALVAAT